LSDFMLFIGYRASKVDTPLFILYVGAAIFYLLFMLMIFYLWITTLLYFIV